MTSANVARRAAVLLFGLMASLGGTLQAQQITPSSLNFGRVAIGEQAQDTLTISEGPGNFSISSSDPAFTVSRSSASGGDSVTVTFTPTQAREYEGTIRFSVSKITRTVTVRGEGFFPTGPVCQIVPQNSEFLLPFCTPLFPGVGAPAAAYLDVEVRVRDDGEPVSGVEITMMQEPEQIRIESDANTDPLGIAYFETEIPATGDTGAVQLTATGMIEGEPFSCGGSMKLVRGPQALLDALIRLYCGIECFAIKDADGLATLRRYRDDVLSPDAEGQSYVDQYYAFTPEILGIAASNPTLALLARDQVQRHAPLIETIVQGGRASLTQADLDEIMGVIEAFEEKTSPEFQEVIAALKGDLANPDFLERFGFDLEAAVPLPKPMPSLDLSRLKTLPDSPSRAHVDHTYGKIPLSFESNEGQAAAGVDYLARAPGYQLFLRSNEVLLTAGSGGGSLKQMATAGGSAGTADAERVASGVRMELVDANRDAGVTALDLRNAKSNYLMGSNPDRWIRNVPHYGRIRYADAYPGIDVVYYGRDGLLEYDFVVAPGVSPDSIGLRFTGVRDTRLQKGGDLLLASATGDLRLKKPFIYQEIGGVRREVAGGYSLDDDGQVGFDLGKYDDAYPLVIDPILSYASFVGGSANEISLDVTVDRDGNTYLTGATTSADLISDSALGNGFLGGGEAGSDGFVMKLNPAGTELIYATYFGGSGDEIGLGLVADSFGRVFVAGATSSTDFPTVSAHQAAFGGAGPIYSTDAFVLKLDATGSELVFSTYLGGEGDDGASAIAIDSLREVYITGATSSSDFPTEDPVQGEHAGGGLFGADAFVTKLNTDGVLLYSTYLGGSEDEAAFGIAVDVDESAYVTGLTYSDDFPVMTPLQEALAGRTDVFVAKIDAGGSDLVYSTYLGGESDEFGLAIDVDDDGNAYLTGLTGSADDFPLSGPAQENFGSEDGLGLDAFVTKVSADGSELTYSTFLGGSEAETGFGIAVDDDGNAFITGETSSGDFPVSGGNQSFLGGMSDGFVTKLDAAGSTFEFATFLGGSNDDFTGGIALDNDGNAYVAGGSGSTNSPATIGALQTSSAGGAADAMVAKIIEGDAPPAIVTVLAASGGLSVSPASISSGFGQGLSQNTVAATEVPLPTELDGVSVRITDSQGAEHSVQFFFVAPGQLNFFVPQGVALGLALVEVLQGGQIIATGTVQVEAVAPGIFTANADGQGAPAAFYLRFRGGEQTAQEFTFDPGAALGEREPVLIDFGAADEEVFVAVFGTGMRGGSVITATIDGVEVPVSPIVALDQFVGLDQANVGPIPRELMGRGVVELRIFVDGVPANVVRLLL